MAKLCITCYKAGFNIFLLNVIKGIKDYSFISHCYIKIVERYLVYLIFECRGQRMDQQGKTCIEFDYTSFLGATGSKKWTFLEAFATIAPIFGLMWKQNIAELSRPEDRLWDAALKSMSSRQKWWIELSSFNSARKAWRDKWITCCHAIFTRLKADWIYWISQ